ncbi:beta-lactamase/transpeptidase-like protein [Leucosporidium creatinivorum]|uniref:Beta-lactamase/transpeptidase-like protein n=1 Tax=Leucosporidium creatinivorum TaxID=106004 RepID=A0A1Y2G0W2_9BASI|nr:beta-lactamase/transpeptidase-like protein [Leucosporidium creatinivorum]
MRPLVLALGLVKLVSAYQQVPFTAPSPTALLSAEFNTFALELLDEWAVPGLSLGIVKVGNDGKLLTDFRGYGTAGKGRKVDQDTLFGIASNSKAFTAAAVAHLVDQGKLSWEDKVTQLLPDLKFSDTFANEQATPIDILSHRTGLPRHEHSYQLGETPKEFVQRISGLRPSAEFRAEWQYNNQMFVTAAYLVSELSGEPFTDFVSSTFFKPLNMTATTYTPLLDDTDAMKHLSSSFATLKNWTSVEIPYNFNATFDQLQLHAGAGGVVSSAQDLVKWLAFLIEQRKTVSGSTTDGSLDTILSPESVKRMTDGHMLQEVASEWPETSAFNYGLGLRSFSYRGVQAINHGGDIPGFGTQLLWSFDRGIGVVALCNADGTGNAVADVAAYRAFDELLRLDKIDWNSRYREKYAVARAERVARISSAFALSTADVVPSDHLKSYIGTYHDYAYGNISVCPSPSSDYPSSTSLPIACSALSQRLDGVLSTDDTPPPSPRALLVAAPGLFGISHLILEHDAGESWKGVAASVFGGVEGREQGLLVYDGSGEIKVELVEGKQVEVWGVWGAGPEVWRREKERRKEGMWGEPEVVFTRV